MAVAIFLSAQRRVIGDGDDTVYPETRNVLTEKIPLLVDNITRSIDLLKGVDALRQWLPADQQACRADRSKCVSRHSDFNNKLVLCIAQHQPDRILGNSNRRLKQHGCKRHCFRKGSIIMNIENSIVSVHHSLLERSVTEQILFPVGE